MSDWLHLSEIAGLADAQWHGQDVAITGISTDSRRVQPGDLFVALKGEHFDAHDFISPELEQQAQALMVHQATVSSLPIVQVDDTLRGLSRWASAWRQQLALKMLSITGSNGKTTVKQMCSSILAQMGSVCATEGNLNNHIGVPLSLLKLRHEHDYAVIELGANHQHEIARLSELALADVSVITNAGPAHLEGFGSLDGVAQAKGEIIDGLSAEGSVVLNADDAYFEQWCERAGKRRVISFGCSEKADYSAQWLFDNCLQLKTAEYELNIQLALQGQHNAYNAAAAAAACAALGATADAIHDGLSSMQAITGRLQMRIGRHGETIFDDSYNANPASVKAAIEVLAAATGSTYLVLGDMGELGSSAGQLHQVIGQFAKSKNIQKVYALGDLSQQTVVGFGPGAQHFSSHADLLAALLQDLSAEQDSSVHILVKGSRSMSMEQIVMGLVATDEQPLSDTQERRC